MAKSKEVATKPEAQLPADLLEEMILDSGDGSQNITTEDVAIPFLRIAQKMSPVCSKRDDAYIPGCEEGVIYNTVTKRLYDGEEGIKVIMCGFFAKHLEWAPRDSGGGLQNSYARGEELPFTEKNERGNDITADGNILSPTKEHYVIVLNDDGTYDKALLSMSSTQLKVSKRWNSLVKQKLINGPNGPVEAPTYAYTYRLKTVMESNNDGEWANFDISDDGPVQDADLYRMARSFSKAVNMGEVKVKHEQAEDAPF